MGFSLLCAAKQRSEAKKQRLGLGCGREAGSNVHNSLSHVACGSDIQITEYRVEMVLRKESKFLETWLAFSPGSAGATGQ